MHKWPREFSLIMLGAAGIILPRLLFAADFSSSNFIVKDPVQSGGGGYGASASFQLWSSFSQPAIGESDSSNNTVKSGFLYFSSESTSPPPPPPPPPSDPGGGGPISPPPPTGGSGETGDIISDIVPPIVSIITGEIIPPQCATEATKRSDLNCDGAVDLQDLSILLTSPKSVTAKTLSFLFSDWTKKLPFFGAEPSNIATESPDGQTIAPSPVSGLAEVGSVVPSESFAPQKASLLKRLGSFAKAIVTGIKALGILMVRWFGF